MCITTKLRTLRLEYGVSLTELAERGGVSNQLISRMELGDVPRTEHIASAQYPDRRGTEAGRDREL